MANPCPPQLLPGQQHGKPTFVQVAVGFVTLSYVVSSECSDGKCTHRKILCCTLGAIESLVAVTCIHSGL